MSLLFKNNLTRARKFFIGATIFFSTWTVLNVGSALELNPPLGIQLAGNAGGLWQSLRLRL